MVRAIDVTTGTAPTPDLPEPPRPVVDRANFPLLEWVMPSRLKPFFLNIL